MMADQNSPISSAHPIEWDELANQAYWLRQDLAEIEFPSQDLLDAHKAAKSSPLIASNLKGAISKALRLVFNHDQAIRRLAVPSKTWYPDGLYKGTVYVRTILAREGGCCSRRKIRSKST